jgi:phosphohistidine phosphatase
MASIELFIWRHAEAEDGVPDLERRLTGAGRRDATHIAKALAQYTRGATMLVSPAVRTRETAAALTDAADVGATVDTRLAPGASVSQVMRSLDDALGAKPRKTSTFVLVGHQPWVGALAHQLLVGTAGDWRFRKAAAWWLYQRQGDPEWALRTVFDPDLVA